MRPAPTQENPGFSAGINAGARLARGRHLLILNPDTRMQPGAVDAMAAYLDAHPDTAVVGARVEDPGGTVQRSARRFPTMLTGLAGRSSLVTRLWPGNPLSRHDTLADATTTAPREVDWVAGSCMAVSADAFRRVGGMDEQFFLYWEDADLGKRLKEAGWKTVYLPSAVVVHGVGRSRRHARALSVRAFHRSAYLYFRKHRAGRFRAISLPVAWAAALRSDVADAGRAGGHSSRLVGAVGSGSPTAGPGAGRAAGRARDVNSCTIRKDARPATSSPNVSTPQITKTARE